MVGRVRSSATSTGSTRPPGRGRRLRGPSPSFALDLRQAKRASAALWPLQLHTSSLKSIPLQRPQWLAGAFGCSLCFPFGATTGRDNSLASRLPRTTRLVLRTFMAGSSGWPIGAAPRRIPDGIVTAKKLGTPLMLEDLGVKLLWDQGGAPKKLVSLELYSPTEAWFEKSWWHGEIELVK